MSSSLAGITQVLHRVRQSIMDHPAYVKGTGGMPDDSSLEDNIRKIATMRDDLAGVLKRLRTIEHSLDLSEQQAWKRPYDQRWSARQSVRDRRDNLGNVYQLVADIFAQIAELEEANRRPAIGDILAEVSKSSADWAKEVTEAITQHKGHYDSIWANPVTIQNVPTAFMIALLVGYFTRQIARRLSG